MRSLERVRLLVLERLRLLVPAGVLEPVELPRMGVEEAQVPEVERLEGEQLVGRLEQPQAERDELGGEEELVVGWLGVEEQVGLELQEQVAECSH